MSLRTRAVVSHIAVALAAIVAAFVVARLLTPEALIQRLHQGGQSGARVEGDARPGQVSQGEGAGRYEGARQSGGAGGAQRGRDGGDHSGGALGDPSPNAAVSQSPALSSGADTNTTPSSSSALAPKGGGVGNDSGAHVVDLTDQVIAAVDQTLLVGVFVGCVVAVLLGWILGSRMTRDVVVLREATSTLASGDFSARVPRGGGPEIDGLAADINTLAEGLDLTEQRRTRLLDDVAHEMRTPLTVVIAGLEALADGITDPGPDTVDPLIRHARRLSRLSEDLTLLAQLQEGVLTHHLSAMNLGELVGSAGHMLAPQATEAGLSWSVEIPDEPVCALVDADRLDQLLTNLVVNAIHATSAPGAISMRLDVHGAWAHLAVTDTGIGMDQATIARVFERFYRVRRADSGGGTGIGLTIAQAIAQAHGGTLRATSAGLGQGSTLTLVIPTIPCDFDSDG